MLTTEQRRRVLMYWLPALVAGLIAWVAFVAFGQTPPFRAGALGLVIIGISLTMRRLGALLAITGGLALAFSPAFWSQTGGTESANPLVVVGVLALAVGVALFAAFLGKRPLLGITLGIALFIVLYWSEIAALRSLRITTLSTAWLIFLLVNALRLTNPRPDELPPKDLRPYHTYGMLLLMAIGVINDPLFTLVAPAVVLGLWLARVTLPVWYWIAMAVITAFGVYGLATTYATSSWFTFPAAQAEAMNVAIPRVIADGWHEPSRWIKLFALVISQYTVFGVVLGVLGLARMARWYPTLGVVMMIGYAAYAFFGLVYFGQDAAVLLLPLLMIQVIWMTYAVYTFGQWLQRSTKSDGQLVRWLAAAAFTLLPLLMLLRIAGILPAG